MAGMKVFLFLLAIETNVTITGSENITVSNSPTAATTRRITTTALEVFSTMTTTPNIQKNTSTIPMSTLPLTTSSPSTTSTSYAEVVDDSETTTLEINWKSTLQPSVSVSTIGSSNSSTRKPSTVTEGTSKPEEQANETPAGESCTTTIISGGIIVSKAGTELILPCAHEPTANISWVTPHNSLENMMNKSILAFNNSTRLPQYNDTGFYYCLADKEKRPSHANLKKCHNWAYVYFKDDKHVFVEDSAYKYIVVEEGKKSVLPCHTSIRNINVDLYHDNKKVHLGVENNILDGQFWKYLPHKGFVLNKSRQEDRGVYTCNTTLKNQSFQLTFILDVISCPEFEILKPEVQYFPAREDNDVYVCCKTFVEKGEMSLINNILRHRVKNISTKKHEVCKNKTVLTGWLLLENVSGTVDYTCNVTDMKENVSYSERQSYESPRNCRHDNKLLGFCRIKKTRWNSLHFTEKCTPGLQNKILSVHEEEFSNNEGNPVIKPDVKYHKNEHETFNVSIVINLIPNYIFSIQWHKNNGELLKETTEEGNGNVPSQLEIQNLTRHHSGNYSVTVRRCTNTTYCPANDKWIQEWRRNFSLDVSYAPVVNLTPLFNSSDTVSIKCRAMGLPLPAVAWEIAKCEHCIIQMTELIENEQTVESSITINNDLPNVIVCIANNSLDTTNETYSYEVKGNETQGSYPLYLLAGGVSSAILIPLACFLGYKCKTIRRKKHQKNQEKGFWTAERSSKLLNPDLPYDRQLEALPYDRKWEYPENRLKMGVMLGSGQFGVVRKAEAFFILPGETISTVAVKISKSYDVMSMEALKSELKIMANLGQHLNVVNLLGACTTNISKGELKLIVEYCHFGNLHDYMLSHRQYFINQINPFTGEIDLTQSTMPLRRKSRIHYAKLFLGITSEECCPSMQLLEEENTNTGRDKHGSLTRTMNRPKKVSSSNRMKNPFSTQDLLCWSFQVARGMEYLASRKVFHGDLAARNTLLADNNIVKICDFGLSKKLYKIKNYKENKHGMVPLKWMAIEYLKDNIYSTESDVWSFGILLWEYFSLGGIPYPGMESDAQLFNKLKTGYRMGPPKYASPKIYSLMKECWNEDPRHRPTFEDLAEKLGNMLSERVRKHYVELNHLYAELKPIESNGYKEPDILSLMRAPTYENSASQRESSFTKESAEEIEDKTETSLDPVDIDSYLFMERSSSLARMDRKTKALTCESSMFEEARACICDESSQPCGCGYELRVYN